MDWVVTSIFNAHDWIPAQVKSPRHRFHIMDSRHNHDRSRSNASAENWKAYWRQARQAWHASNAGGMSAGIITTFPQLALMAGLIKRLTWSRKPVVAWMFNMGQTYGGVKGHLARFGLASVDKFVVHSTHEIGVYSQWLGLPKERFEFVPLSVAQKDVTEEEETQSPFLLSMGTNSRDYALLLRVLAQVPYPAIIVAGTRALAGLEIPPNVQVMSGVPIEECHKLCQRARISIIPLASTSTAAGQVSVLEAMMFGRPVIATRCIGTEDYVENNVDGLLVEASSESALRDAIDHLWNDADARNRMAAAARQSSLAKYTFKGVSTHMERIVDQLQG